MIDVMSFTFYHHMIVIPFFHNLNMYCRQIRNTIAECKIEMHKKKEEDRDLKGVYFCCFIICDVIFLRCLM